MIIDKVQDAVEAFQDERGQPYYSYGTWNDEANRLTEIERISGAEDIKFPLVFLLLPVNEEFIQSEGWYEGTLNFFILGKTKQEYNAKTRHENEMPALRTIETNLLLNLKSNNISFTDYERIERFYPENQLNTPVNAIELSIPAKYQLQCLT